MKIYFNSHTFDVIFQHNNKLWLISCDEKMTISEFASVIIMIKKGSLDPSTEFKFLCETKDTPQCQP